MNFIKSALRKILNKIQSIEVIICAIGLVTTTLLVFSQVVNRYWLHFEIMWFGDLALYTFIFFMLLAAACTTWREGHIAVEYFHEKVFNGKPKGTTIHRSTIVFISIVLACIFLPTSYKFMLRAMKYPEYGTLVRWFNTSWLQITLFVAFALVVLHLFVIARRDIGDVIKIYRSKDGM
jgi:C4-dicarboxylate transporter DctQ subunit